MKYKETYKKKKLKYKSKACPGNSLSDVSTAEKSTEYNVNFEILRTTYYY